MTGASSAVGLLYSSNEGNLCKSEAERLLFHQRLAQGHVDTALHLADDQHGVVGTADIVSDPDLGDLDFTGLEVAVDLDDRRRVRIRWAGTDPGSLVRSGQTGRRIAAAAGYHPALRFGALHGLGEGQPIGRPVAAVDPVVARREVSG